MDEKEEAAKAARLARKAENLRAWERFACAALAGHLAYSSEDDSISDIGSSAAGWADEMMKHRETRRKCL